MDEKYAEALLLEERINNLICDLRLFQKNLPMVSKGKFELSQALALLQESGIYMDRFLTKY
jgi:hypothetical protein